MAEAAIAATIGATASMLGSVFQLWDPLMREFAPASSVEEILDALKKAVGVLRSKRKDYQNEVEGHKMKVPSETYKEWIRTVMEIEDQVDKLVAKHDKESKKPSFSFSTTSTFREELVKKHEQVIKLLESDQIWDKLLVDQPPERVMKMRAPDIKKFETLQKSLEQVLGLLRNDKVKGIKIHGTVGIGKTTIMLNLNNHDEVAKMFDIVIWVKVSTEGSKENMSIEHLQQAVLRRLRLNIEGTERADELAHGISKELKDKKYLLLMDDVKQDLNLYDLYEMGFPDGKNGSKIVLTTRLGHVCYSLVNRVIKVTNLSPGEAWEMFQDVLECPQFIEDPKIGPLAWRVCNDCGGLPLVIQKVASTFKVKDKEWWWSDGLNSWRMWPQEECQGIREMYNMLKFCYDNLNDDQKNCFLYGALYPEDSEIYTDYLLECWAAEDFLDHAKNMKAKNGHVILSHLKNVSLLEETMREKYITMHKFIRQVALYIASKDPKCKYLVKPNGALQEAPDEESWSEKNCISLSDNEFDKLPDCPDCGMLSTLFLQKNLELTTVSENFFDQKNLELTTVSENFFDHMTKLRVLNFCQIGIIKLPISVSKLISLKVLYLCGCKYLRDLPSAVGKLPHLEVLDIRGSGIHNIPIHIENFEGLRCLRISFPNSGNVNGTPKISRLSALEELVIDMEEFEQWSNKVLIENIINEVAILKKLTILKLCFPDKVVDVIEVATTFRIHVPDASILQTFMKSDLFWRNVKQSFRLLISCKIPEHPQIPEHFKYARYIKYCNGKGPTPFPEVFAKAQAIELVNHKDIKQLSDFGIASMTQIRSCLIESCNKIETIISGVDCKIILNLEHLYMKNLPKLESIWKVPIQFVCLTKLETLVLSSCQMLKKIFPPGVIDQLEMQYLKIEDCPGIVEIFEESETSGHRHVLPKLKKFVLIDMPKLERICANELLNWPSLENLEICNCPSLPYLLSMTDNAPKLKHFKREEH